VLQSQLSSASAKSLRFVTKIKERTLMTSMINVFQIESTVENLVLFSDKTASEQTPCSVRFEAFCIYLHGSITKTASIMDRLVDGI
jgi:hypothetical protein